MMYASPKATLTKRDFTVEGYDIIKLLGTGAHSSLWEIKDQQTDELRTLKRVVKTQKSDERFFEQTINEYEVAQRVSHATIRKVYELRRIRKMLAVKELHLIMEYCPGENLQKCPPKSVPNAVVTFMQTAYALMQMNKAGLVHADMKPSNIILDEKGRVKIIDLGQCCEIGTVKPRVQGTPDFIAPEQVNKLPLDVRTDIFNFGATMYWCLTGKPGPLVLPPEGSLQTTSTPKVDPPSKHNPDIPPMLDRLVLDCVQLNATERPQTIKEVGNRLWIILEKLKGKTAK